MKPLYVLIDAATKRILVASYRIELIGLLQSTDGDTRFWKILPGKLYGGKTRNLMRFLHKNKCYHFVPVGNNGQIRRTVTPPDEKIVQRSRLLMAKRGVFSRLVKAINQNRKKLCGPLVASNIIDWIRSEQARQLKMASYQIEHRDQYIYVLQYADAFSLTAKEAADRILLETELKVDALWKTEALKLKYWDKIQFEDDVEKVKSSYGQFMQEFYVNAQI